MGGVGGPGPAHPDCHNLPADRATGWARRHSPQEGAGWHLDSVTTSKVLEWLDSDLPEAGSVRAKRDMELHLIDHSALTLVVSPDEIEVIHHYRPETKVGGWLGEGG